MKQERCALKPLDFLSTAQLLATSRRGRPTQVNLRRAISTTYYALFHAVARNCADLVAGGQTSARSKHAWRQVYRALEHGAAKTACLNAVVVSKFPKPI